MTRLRASGARGLLRAMRLGFFAASAVSVLFAACSSDPSTSDAGADASGRADAPDAGPPDTSACNGFSADAGVDPSSLMREGRTAAEACAFCHRQNSVFAGQDYPRPQSTQYGANITPDPATGIGRYTDEEFCRVVRFGIARDGRSLCSLMTRYDATMLTDGNIRALLFFLRAQPPVVRMIPASTCP